jgi:hypothetical protein
MNYADVQIAVARQQEREFAASIRNARTPGALRRILALIANR